MAFSFIFLNSKAMKAYFCLPAGWLVPGLGHILQKKIWRGAVFFVSILALTAIGLSMGGRVYSFPTENPLAILAFFADLGTLVLSALARPLPRREHPKSRRKYGLSLFLIMVVGALAFGWFMYLFAR